MSVIIKTVLRSGSEYKPEHVQRIQQQLGRPVVCYTDLPAIDGIEVRPLLHDWPGWWSKLEVFREIEDSFYIDLDMTIAGDISDIINTDPADGLIALRNMKPEIGGIGSAMMRWRRDMRKVYKLFCTDPQYVMDNYGIDKRGTRWLGDQGWVGACVDELEIPLQYWQDLYPGRIKAWYEQGDADIIVYFGRSRPWTSG